MTRDTLAALIGAFLLGAALGLWAARQAGDAASAKWERQRDSVTAAHAAREGELVRTRDSALSRLARLSVPTPRPRQSPTVRTDTIQVPTFVDSESVHAWRRYAFDQRARADEAEAERVVAYQYGMTEAARADSLAQTGRALAGVLAVRDSQIVALQRLTRTAPVRRRMAGGLAVEVLGDLGGGLEVAGTAALPLSGRVAILARASAGPEGQMVRAGLRVGL